MGVIFTGIKITPIEAIKWIWFEKILFVRTAVTSKDFKNLKKTENRGKKCLDIDRLNSAVTKLQARFNQKNHEILKSNITYAVGGRF